MAPRRGVRAAAMLLALVAGGGCALPTPMARGTDDYGKKAASTAEDVRSAVQTTIVALKAKGDEKLTTRALDVFVTEAEAEADSAASTFRSIDPPSSSKDDLDLRDRTIELVDGAVDALQEVRLDVRLGHAADAPDHVHDLEQLADDLESFSKEVG